MSAGKRDQLISFEQRETTIDPVYGTNVEGDWTQVSQAWAEVQDVLPSRSESLADGINLSRQPCRIRIDFYDGVGITSAMRIAIEGDAVRPARSMRIISGPAFVEKTSEWELIAEQLSSSGEEP